MSLKIVLEQCTLIKRIDEAHNGKEGIEKILEDSKN